MIRASRTLALVALAASAGFHAAGMIAIAPDPAPVRIEGGAPANAPRLGNSFRDMVAGTAQPVSPEVVRDPVGAEAIEPVQADAREALTTAQAEPLPNMLAKPTMIDAVKPVPTDAVESETALIPPLSQSSVMSPVRPGPAETSQPAIKTLTSDDESPAPVLSQRPVARPEHIEAKAKPTPVRKPRQQQGQGAVNERRGTVEGQRQAATTERSDAPAKASALAGNAAASNYPGIVNKKIRRIRRPRINSRGTVTIAFKIASNGGLSSVRVARSSGSDALDRAGLDIVRRAAPFPRPPAGAQRSFSIGIKGR